MFCIIIFIDPDLIIIWNTICILMYDDGCKEILSKLSYPPSAR